jgi:polyisoprenoid-binding protein YceI
MKILPENITLWFAAAVLAGVYHSAYACWIPVKTPAALVFHTSQPGGTEIRGEFPRFDGLICLDPDDKGTDLVRLHVQTGSVDTKLPELDEALRGPVFLGSAQWPQATFESESVQRLDDQGHYKVKGIFTLRDVSKTIEVPFTLVPSPDTRTAKLAGETAINRLDYGVGQGRWSDTQWADNKVTLEFSVSLKRMDSQRK